MQSREDIPSVSAALSKDRALGKRFRQELRLEQGLQGRAGPEWWEDRGKENSADGGNWKCWHCGDEEGSVSVGKAAGSRSRQG